jgi:hypothetical protein
MLRVKKMEAKKKKRINSTPVTLSPSIVFCIPYTGAVVSLGI